MTESAKQAAKTDTCAAEPRAKHTASAERRHGMSTQTTASKGGRQGYPVKDGVGFLARFAAVDGRQARVALREACGRKG